MSRYAPYLSLKNSELGIIAEDAMETLDFNHLLEVDRILARRNSPGSAKLAIWIWDGFIEFAEKRQERWVVRLEKAELMRSQNQEVNSSSAMNTTYRKIKFSEIRLNGQEAIETLDFNHLLEIDHLLITRNSIAAANFAIEIWKGIIEFAAKRRGKRMQALEKAELKRLQN